MSSFIGTNVVKDGLVFEYDMSNTQKSWKGAPATNILSNTTALSRWSKSGGISSVVDNALAPDNTYTASIVTANGTTGSYLGLGSTITSGNTYTKSVIAKAGSTGTLVFESYDNNGSGGTGYYTTYFNLINGTYSGTGHTSSILPIGNGWYKCIATRDYTLTTGGGTFYVGAYGAGSGYLYLWRPQMELGTTASEFTVGTRSNTQAITDITKNNTITASNLTYTSDNTFSFNGSNSLYIPSIDFSNEQTIEIWLKPTENDAVRRNPYNQAYGGFGTWTHEPSGVFNYYYGDSGSNSPPYIGHQSSFTVIQNELACLCTTRNTTESWWYKNGVKYNSYSHTFGQLLATTANITIGTGYAGGYVGNIYLVRLYNRALTQAEIAQNFEATRGRYGI